MSLQTLTLDSKAFKFNPGFQSDEEAIINFIVRKEPLRRIVEAFRYPGPGNPPRVLVIAPRGAGKTTLCRRVMAELPRSPTLSAAWHPIFLPEESYPVTTPGEFFLECLFHLHERTKEASLKREYDEALQLPHEKELLTKTVRVLKAFAERERKRLLIIVENFRIILDDQIGAGQKDLLKHLRDERLFGVLATTVTRWEPDQKDDAPTGFQEIRLPALSLEECHALWKSLTDRDVKRDRIRPLQILTGGSPRLLHILAEFMRTPSLRNLMDNLEFLIDQNTEYFKNQLDALPAVERKVFAALLDAWDPCSAKQVAEAARLTTNGASAMLARLLARGHVIKEQGKGRTAIYYAAERLFNIYYLMRRRSHPSSRVRALVTFMTEYYDRDELVDTATILAREACTVRPDSRSDYHSTFEALLSKAPKADQARILAQAPADFMRTFEEHWKAGHNNQAFTAKSLTADAGEDDEILRGILGRSRRAMQRDDVDESMRLMTAASDTYPLSPSVWLQLALLRLQRGEYMQMIEAARRLGELDNQGAWGYALEGLARAGMEELQEARACFERALELDPDHPIALAELAELCEIDGETERALELYHKAQASETLADSSRARYARLLASSGSEAKAEKVLRAGINEPDAYNTRRALAQFFHNAGRGSEATRMLSEAAERFRTAQAWDDLGYYLQEYDSDYGASRDALLKAIEIGADDPSVYVRFANATAKAGGDNEAISEIAADVTRRFPTLSKAWLVAGFIHQLAGDVAKAEAATRSALDLSESVSGWLQLGRILEQQPPRMADAEAAFRKAVDRSEGPFRCGPLKELAELLVHAGDDEGAKRVLVDALESNADCYCCRIVQAEIAARVGNRDAAEKSYQSALDIQEDGVEALTGLSRFVPRTAAAKLIKRALEAEPGNPRCYLAQAQLEADDVMAQIEAAQKALKISPDFAEAHIFLMPLLAQQGDTDTAIAHLQAALDALPRRRELIPLFVDATMAVAAAAIGAGEKVSKVIESHKYGSSIEPLIVALRLKRGEKPVVAKEILAVAEDIADAVRKR
jgi:tetratricopeptide (TPR) repeat protein